jgi:TnpA family transposase
MEKMHFTGWTSVLTKISESSSESMRIRSTSYPSGEVAAMIEGVLRHDTEMDIEKQYVDTHGQSEIGFAFCYLLGFALLPRLKNIKKQRLYRPYKEELEKYANLQSILTRLINWEIIEQQYDQLIKFATALRLGTADAESILRHSLYQEQRPAPHLQGAM